MNFLLADTFTASLARLTGDEQKAVKTTAFDLQMDPAAPGMQFHKLDKARDKNFWSVRVNRDIRLIVHRTDDSLLLCYVDHHDDAYAWAERRKIERHPRTGAAQLVEIRETVQEIAIPRYVEQAPAVAAKPRLFESLSAETLLGYGVPDEWLDDVHQADEDSLLELAGHLPGEAAEALLCLATGGTPTMAAPPAEDASPFEHPDAQRRFRLLTDVEELAAALDYPWEKWTVFLHPAQRELVERKWNGPARVAGTAGTGKTVVALHRAAYLAKANPSARVLVTTFNNILADALREKLRRLLGGQPKVLERIEVAAIGTVGERLYASRIGPMHVAADKAVRFLLREAATGVPTLFAATFLWSEFADIVDAWQVRTWDQYRDVPRLGRKKRLSEAQRKLLWPIFEAVHAQLAESQQVTRAEMFSRLTDDLSANGGGPYDYIVVDEAQDISVAELRFLPALGAGRPDSLFFAGDLGQRIFQLPFSWKSLGVDVRGRSRMLRINYRTSHQIRRQADQLLPAELADVDGEKEDRRGTVSAFNGPEPCVLIAETEEAEIAAVADWLKRRKAEGVLPEEVGVFVRSHQQVDRAKQAVDRAVLPVAMGALTGGPGNAVSILTMHEAKGMEFRDVAVMACDDEILPLQERIAAAADESDLEEVYNTERHLLYVACTRARDHLLVTGVAPASEFLGDFSAR